MMEGCPECALLPQNPKDGGLGLSCVLPAVWGRGAVSPLLLPRGHSPIAAVLEGPRRIQACVGAFMGAARLSRAPGVLTELCLAPCRGAGGRHLHRHAADPHHGPRSHRAGRER